MSDEYKKMWVELKKRVLWNEEHCQKHYIDRPDLVAEGLGYARILGEMEELEMKNLGEDKSEGEA